MPSLLSTLGVYYDGVGCTPTPWGARKVRRTLATSVGFRIGFDSKSSGNMAALLYPWGVVDSGANEIMASFLGKGASTPALENHVFQDPVLESASGRDSAEES